MPSPTRSDWIILIALGMIWGASFMFISVALRGFAPLHVAAFRILIAATFLWVVLHLRGQQLPGFASTEERRIWLFAFGMGVFSNALPFTLLSWGQTTVPSGFAGVSMAVVPLLVLPLAHVFVPGDSMTLRKTLGFLAGTLGVAVLIGPGAFEASGGDWEMLARLACLGGALCYAIGSILTRRCPPVSLLALSTAALICATLQLLPIALWQEGLPEAPGPLPLAALLYLGLLPTALAQILLTKVIRSAGPAFLSTVNYQVPVWSVVFGALFLAEAVPPQLLIALALILGGVLISQGRKGPAQNRA